METLEQIKNRLQISLPGLGASIIPNGSAANQPSLLVDAAQGAAVAEFLRDDPELKLDYVSNVTGIDWLDSTVKEKIKVRKTVDGVEKEIEETVARVIPGFLEAVYHF